MDTGDDLGRSLTYAEAALAHMKRDGTPPHPRNFEIWYSFAAGANRGLTRAVNEILAQEGRVTADELDRLYDRFLSPARIGDRIEELGGKVAGEISDLVKLVNSTLDFTSEFNASVKEAAVELDGAAAAEEIRRVTKKLLASTIQVASSNHHLDMRFAHAEAELAALQANLEAIRSEALTDPLTTLANRKHFDQSIEQAVASADDEGSPLSLLITDIDHFKSFNDAYGHQTGDQVLKLVALAVKQNVKGKDVACRYGGEEFAVILPHTDLLNAEIVGGHIREAVMKKELVKRSTGEPLGHVTVSIGISSYRRGESAHGLIERADSCLYLAKRSGRNRVISEGTAPVARRAVA